LKLEYDELLSNVAFNCNLRPSNLVYPSAVGFRHGLGGAVQVDPGLEAVDPTLAFSS
jgi:hypothetical protein